MSDDNGDEIMIGPMPAVEDYSEVSLETTEPDEEDATEGITLTDSRIKTISKHNNNTNGFDNDTDYDYQDNTTSTTTTTATNNNNNNLVDPPSPQALFFLSEMGESLDDLTYDPHILQLAETNKVDIPWIDLKPIIRNTILKQCDTMETVVTDTEVQSTITSIKTNILHCIDHHSGTPFTIQRLCELISAPTKHYSLFIKYLHAIEKVLSVASTWDSFCEESPADAPPDSLSLSQQQQQHENDMYTGYEMPDMDLVVAFDDDVDLDDKEDDEGDDDDDNDDDDDDDDDDDNDFDHGINNNNSSNEQVMDEIETEGIDSMEMDNAPTTNDHEMQVNGAVTTMDDDNNNSTYAMDDDDNDNDRDMDQDHQVPSSSSSNR